MPFQHERSKEGAIMSEAEIAFYLAPQSRAVTAHRGGV
jgi:hypothetical protein